VPPPDVPDPLPPRDPHRVAVVARLEPQKRLQDAIAAFAQVVAAVPEARLDIYGDGSRRDALQAEIDALAPRVVELLRSPELVARMSEAARATAAGYGPDGFVTRWGEVLRTAGRQ